MQSVQPLASTVDPQADPDPRWWHSFGDPILDQLIARARAGNLDLRIAVQRIVAARSQEQAARAQGLPSLTANGSYKRQQLGARGLIDEQGSSLATLTNSADAKPIIKAIEAPLSLFQAGFDASWELDLFGRVRRATEAAEAQTQGSIESRNDALLSLEAEVAQNYIQLRSAQQLRDLNRLQIADSEQLVALAENRQRVGLAPQSDVESARAQASAIEATLPQYDVQIAVAQDALAVLIGETPGTLGALLDSRAPVPVIPALVPVGLPAALARRRPDIRAAEANLHAANAEVGVAMAQLFPDVTLAATDGFRAVQARYLARWANNFWSIAPSISLPIFEGGALDAGVNNARAEAAAALLAYRKAVLAALQDVDNAMTSYSEIQVQVRATDKGVGANRRALDLALESYRHGLVSFVTVLNARQQLRQDEEQRAQLNAQTCLDLIGLYKALGGGWQDDPSTGQAH